MRVHAVRNFMQLGVVVKLKWSMLDYCMLESSVKTRPLCLLGGGCCGIIRHCAAFISWSEICRCKESVSLYCSDWASSVLHLYYSYKHVLVSVYNCHTFDIDAFSVCTCKVVHTSTSESCVLVWHVCRLWHSRLQCLKLRLWPRKSASEKWQNQRSRAL